jgi:DNA-binding MarR family transcriptional regulator
VTERESWEEFGRAFGAVTAAVRRLKGRETHRPGEMSYAQYGLLFRLADEGPLPTGELALLADLSPATATQMLESLAKGGFVERVRSETDKRVVLSSLTDRGRQLVEERRTFFEERWRRALAEFSDQDLDTAAAILDRIRSMFEEMAERPVVEAPAESAA